MYYSGGGGGGAGGGEQYVATILPETIIFNTRAM